MSGDPSGSARRPSWKGEAGGSTRRGPRYAWKPETAAARPRRRWRHLLIAGAAVGCVVLIVVLFKLLQPPPRAGLVLVAADPAEDVDRLDVPLDAYSWQGGRHLARLPADAGAPATSGH